MVIAFAGHSFVYSKDEVKKAVREAIKKQISGHEFITFYLGGYGDFDDLCARVCKELKKELGCMELVYVTPYRTMSEQAKIKEMQSWGFCDVAVYPPIENTPPKFAICKRNEWMMTNADLIIAYVHKEYGGAYKALQVAKRKNKKIVNIYELLGSPSEDKKGKVRTKTVDKLCRSCYDIDK